MNRIVIVDVCGTLYDENTTAGFVRFLVAQSCIRRMGRFWLLQLLRTKLTRNFVIILGIVLNRDLFRIGYISCLKGISRNDLQYYAVEYAKVLERETAIPLVRDRLKKFESNGWQPILVSNSLDLVISEIGGMLGYDWLASSLGWQGDICTGKLSRDLKGRKLEAFEEAFGSFRTKKIAVMTDNRSDIDLIDAASLSVLIAKRKPKPWMKKYVSEQIYY